MTTTCSKLWKARALLMRGLEFLDPQPMPSMRLLPLVVVALFAAPAAAQVAQPAPTTTMTLDEAVVLARRNNPTFLQIANQRKTADAAVRSAYGDFLPSSSASFSSRYQQGGKQIFQGATLESSDNMSSSYSVGLNYSLSAATLLAPRAARANRDATEAEIGGAAEALRSAVVQQYINTLQAEARAALADTLMLTTKGQLDLAQARVAVGAGNALDVRRAEVAVGQAEVATLIAYNNAQLEMLRLFQQLGVPMPEGGVRLVTQFSVTRPAFTKDSLLQLARRINPAVNALRSRVSASGVDLKVAKSRYTPTLSLSTGVGGQAFELTNPDLAIQQAQLSTQSSLRNCLTTDSLRVGAGLRARGCSSIVFTDEDAAAIRNENNKFPFKFNRAPLGMSAFLSIPLFDGFSREQAVEQAEVSRENQQFALRARELQLTTEVTQAYLNLMTALRTVELQEQNARKAREELAFAEERFRAGAAPFLDVTTSRGTFAQAQIDRVNAIYDYHKAFAALETAVGRPLR
jgi:outer membrane protein